MFTKFKLQFVNIYSGQLNSFPNFEIILVEYGNMQDVSEWLFWYARSLIARSLIARSLIARSLIARSLIAPLNKLKNYQ